MPDPARLSEQPPSLRPATRPTMYFIGVTTGGSASLRAYPRWAELLGLGHTQLVGVDLPLGAPAGHYRQVVDFIVADPLSAGALVTTHKLDLYAACEDRLTIGDAFAGFMREASCLAKRDGRLVAFAKDAVTGALALSGILNTNHFAATGAEALILGAGGAGTAIAWTLLDPGRGADRPRRLVVTDTRADRLDAVAAVGRRAGDTVPLELIQVTGTAEADAAVAGLADDSLVVNATGLGKDRPGSPLSAAPFPDRAIAWDLNYRGDLIFLDQAREAAAQAVRDEDGWSYFVHGWTQHMAEVFGLDTQLVADRYKSLAAAAAEIRT